MTNETTKTTEQTATESKAPKVLTVIDDMPQRRMFDSRDEATAYIVKCQEDFADFAGYPVAAVGLTEEGDFDPEVYTAEMRVGVYVLTKRGGEEAGGTQVHAIVIAPAPKVTAFLGLSDEDAALFTNTTGLTWLTGIIDKEINHVTVRALRKATDAQEIAEAVESMPRTLADFITSGRETSSGILETYNALWQLIKKGVGARNKAFANANLSKKELRRGMESASYAATVYPQLESRVDKAGNPQSLFVIAATFGQVLAKQPEHSLDSTIFDRMIATRDEYKIDIADDGDDFDFEKMAAALAAPAPAAEPAPEGEAQPEEAAAE